MAQFDIEQGDGAFTGTHEDDLFFSTTVRWSAATPHGFLDGGMGYDTVDLSAIAPSWCSVIQGEAGNWTMAVGLGSQTVELANVEHVLLGNDANSCNFFIAGPLDVETGGGDDYARFAGTVRLDLGTGNDSVDLLSNGSFSGGAITGGDGYDTITLDRFSAFLEAHWTVDLAAGTATTKSWSGQSTYAISSVERILALTGATVLGSAAAEHFEVFSEGAPEGVTLDGRGGDDVLLGWSYADVLIGGDGDDVVDGGPGSDRLDGGDGVDTVAFTRFLDGVSVDLSLARAQPTAGADRDVIVGFENVVGSHDGDRLKGSGAANLLSGADGGDVLIGRDGDDVLVGDTGRDTLTGGEGRDLFRFAAGDTAASRAAADRIIDFAAGADRIDLAAIDADVRSVSDDAFTFIGADRFSHLAGELRCVAAHGALFVSGDVDGDGRADFTIRVAGATELQATDFVL